MNLGKGSQTSLPFGKFRTRMKEEQRAQVLPDLPKRFLIIPGHTAANNESSVCVNIQPHSDYGATNEQASLMDNKE